MKKLQQKSTWAGVFNILLAAAGIYTQSADPVTAGGLISSGIGLIVADA